jgi:hypothetical protein
MSPANPLGGASPNALGMPIMPGMGMMPGMMGGMGMMPGMMGGIGMMPGMMGGMGFNPQAMALAPMFQKAQELDVLLATSKISPKQFSQSLVKLLFQSKRTMFQLRHPLLNFIAIGANALLGSTEIKKDAGPVAQESGARHGV